ncbi:MAG: DEAD/DEAH box helicase [Actinobacteria bacterium]|nr:DEAD/DEAH box helicase [Actinomycetota bacterium]
MIDPPSAFTAGYDFALDDFQVAGIAALEAGRSVLVAAPTGSGKTVVGEFATWAALRDGGKCFYTTPIKALSNQKYQDLCARYGDADVGLLTGDRSINGEAPVVVMTTEVLRNMLYQQSSTLSGLQSVVLDEVHYLADRARGAVWEEVIVQLPAAVQLVCLSATISNAEEFGAWLADVRLGCEVIISEQRPVPLDHHYAIGDRLYEMFRSGHGPAGRKDRGGRRGADARRASGGVPNPKVVMLERQAVGQRRARGRRGGHTGVRLRPPRRSELVRLLAQRRWLPAIVFVFSRAGCDRAVEQLVGDGVRLTSADERSQIRRLSRELTAATDAADLHALGFARLSDALERGIASHHAGMVPVLKELVEALFVRGLVKVCFATETLALGINMPARTVAIEQLEKWDGQQHQLLTPGQFTQLTGRAGRRGLDTLGHAVVSYQRQLDFAEVAGLVGQRVEPLRSSFAPTYNMAVNLLRRRTLAESAMLLEQSFAQYQAAAGVATLTQRIADNRAALDGYAANLSSTYGDADEYLALRRELRALERGGAKQRRDRRRRAVLDVLEGLQDGDVVTLADGAGVGAVVGGAGSARAQVVTEDRKLTRLHPQHYRRPPTVVGRIVLPTSGGPRQATYRRRVADALTDIGRSNGTSAAPVVPDGDGADQAARLEHLRSTLRAHPVDRDPALAELERWASRYDELAARTRAVERDVERLTGSLARALRRIVTVLTALGYLTGSSDAPRPTEDGLRLAGLYADTDLLLAECVRDGVLQDLTGPDLASVVSVFVYETRAKDAPPARYPSPQVAERVTRIEQQWELLAAREQQAGLQPVREPDAGLCEQVWRWAQGAELDDVLGGSDLTGGDFVRSVKQVADLCRQLGVVYADTGLGSQARRTADLLLRGVVAAG